MIVVIPFFNFENGRAKALELNLRRLELEPSVINVYLFCHPEFELRYECKKIKMIKMDYVFAGMRQFIIDTFDVVRSIHFNLVLFMLPDVYLNFNAITKNKRTSRLSFFHPYGKLLKLTCEESGCLFNGEEIKLPLCRLKNRCYELDGEDTMYAVVYKKPYFSWCNKNSIYLKELPKNIEEIALGLEFGEPIKNTEKYAVVVSNYMEKTSGIYGFVSKWLRYVPNYVRCDFFNELEKNKDYFYSDPLIIGAKCVIFDFHWTWNHHVAKRFMKALSYIPKGIRKIAIVHEINYLSIPSLNSMDFLVYMSSYQKIIGESILKINTPSINVNGLPSDISSISECQNDLPFIYIGGKHLCGKNVVKIIGDALSKTKDAGIEKDSRFLIKVLNNSGGSDIDNALQNYILSDEKLKDKVIIHWPAIRSYFDFCNILRRVKYAYLSREQDLSLSVFLKMIDSRDSKLGLSYIGESGTLRDCLEARCQVFVSDKARYASYLCDTLCPLTNKAFSKMMMEIVNE
jgi:hypothetical protein